MTAAAHTIRKACRRWIARRGGPLVWFREESNNPYDFFSSDPVADIPLRDFVSFVDAGKGYCMDSKSAMSLVTHANTNHEPALNPFTRAPLPPTFLRRLRLHGTIGEWEPLQAQTPEQTLNLATTDLFRAMEDLGYYTDPAWFTSLGRTSLQRFYIELADIWYHRAQLTRADQQRIVPGARVRIRPFPVPISHIVPMTKSELSSLMVNVCTVLVTAASERSDRQLGVMYVLGALTLISSGARAANPWILEMFSPGVTTMTPEGNIGVAHPSILAY